MQKAKDIHVLELKARNAARLAEARAQEFKEHVGLVFEFDAQALRVSGLQALGALAEDPTLVLELENVGPAGKFKVSTEELTLAAQYLVQKYGPRVHEYIEHVTLWHSHYNTVEPSEQDIAEFPFRLCDQGNVYHAPTGSNTRYSNVGIISPLIHSSLRVATVEV